MIFAVPLEMTIIMMVTTMIKKTFGYFALAYRKLRLTIFITGINIAVNNKYVIVTEQRFRGVWRG